MNDAANDDSTPLGFPPLTLPAPRVHGLLGDVYAPPPPPSPRPTAFDLWMAANLQQVIAGALAKAPVTTLIQADADAFWRLVCQPPADDVSGNLAKPEEPLAAPDAILQVAPEPRTATSADLDAGIRWSAAKAKDGLTSGNQLHDDAPSWCEQNGVVYGKLSDWENRLTSDHKKLKRRGRPRGS